MFRIDVKEILSKSFQKVRCLDRPESHFPAYPLVAQIIYQEDGKVSQLVKEVKSREEERKERTIDRPRSMIRRRLKCTVKGMNEEETDELEGYTRCKNKLREESFHKNTIKKNGRWFGTAAINQTNGAAHVGAKKTGREVRS